MLLLRRSAAPAPDPVAASAPGSPPALSGCRRRHLRGRSECQCVAIPALRCPVYVRALRHSLAGHAPPAPVASGKPAIGIVTGTRHPGSLPDAGWTQAMLRALAPLHPPLADHVVRHGATRPSARPGLSRAGRPPRAATRDRQIRSRSSRRSTTGFTTQRISISPKWSGRANWRPETVWNFYGISATGGPGWWNRIPIRQKSHPIHGGRSGAQGTPRVRCPSKSTTDRRLLPDP